MRKALASPIAVLAVLTLLALPSLAAAGEFEIGGFAGYTFPFYSQTYKYDPGLVTIPDFPEITIRQSGGFELKASGGVVLGGAAAFFPIDPVGLELRFDSANVTFKTQSPTYNVTATLPEPLAPVTANLTLKESEAKLSSAQPFSLNLKLRTSGDTRVFVSGGFSYLPNMGFSLDQTVALGVSEVNLVENNLKISTITLRARRKPGDPKSNWGANAGLGFRVPLGEHGGLVLEGRGFYFPKQTFEWEAVIDPKTPLSDVQQKLLDGVLRQIDPKTVEFKPWWVQATIGVYYRF